MKNTLEWEKNISFLEKITEHKFIDISLLIQSLTHSSAKNTQENYERLEFLGDRVLGLMVADMLYRFFPDADEGELSIRLNALVNAQTCAEIAKEISLPDIIHMGLEMKMLDTRRRTNMYADVVEALIAVLYLEGGLDAVRPLVKKFWLHRIYHCQGSNRDAKTQLQEWAHQQNGSQPLYRVVSRKGPDHEPLFEVEVCITGFTPSRGEGASKRHAERAAALALLEREGAYNEEKKK